MVQSVELGLDQNTDPSRMRSPAIDGAVHRTLHVHQHLHHRPDGMVSKIPIRTQDGLGGNVLYPLGHNGELEKPTKGEFAGSINCDDPMRAPGPQKVLKRPCLSYLLKIGFRKGSFAFDMF
ncbi:uncharacterized protein TNIN_248261 [Trichonephila inaurata madagascariensis]|uniref:Uncharacterized protein n=1 Tax=Trichonephila inaurata madagascariensis TaxID=2747483 RepID=A0A8X7CB29_9ARAC|nr:uncharacterized protein TNIN_248261 [Trichonephila inaurata madagascariensis]